MLYDTRWDKPVETKPMEPWRELLLKTADVIEKCGHAKHALIEPETGAVCLLGAMNSAEHGVPWAMSISTTRKQALSALCRLQKVSLFSESEEIVHLVGWNNAPERTGAHVIQACRDAASI